VSGEKLLAERSALSKAPIWDKTSAEAQGGKLLQRGYSGILKQQYPGIKVPDWLYHQYSKGTGTLGWLAKRLLPWMVGAGILRAIQ